MEKYLFWIVGLLALSGQALAQPDELYEEAIRLQNGNQHAEALAVLNKCLSQNAGFVEAYFARANSREQLKDLQGSLTDLNTCLELLPDQYEVLLSRGSLLFRLGRYPQAKADFKKLLTLSKGETNTIFYRRSAHGAGTDKIMTVQGSSESQIFNYLGLIELQLGNGKQALIHLDSAIALNNTDPDLYVNRAIVKQTLRDSTFEEDFKKALELNPDHAIAKNNIAIQLAKTGSFTETEKRLTEAIASDSTLYFSYVERGYYRYMNGDLNAALSDYDQAIRLNSTDAEVWLNRGLVKEKLHDLIGAFADYTQAIELKENFVKAWLNRGNVLMRQQRYDNAAEDYSAAIIYQPDYGHAYFNRAIALYKLKKHGEACIDLQRAEKLGVVIDAKMKKSICK